MMGLIGTFAPCPSTATGDTTGRKVAPAARCRICRRSMCIASSPKEDESPRCLAITKLFQFRCVSKLSTISGFGTLLPANAAACPQVAKADAPPSPAQARVPAGAGARNAQATSAGPQSLLEERRRAGRLELIEP